MKEWLVLASENAIVVIDELALLIIVFGTIEAFIAGVRMVTSSPSGLEGRDVWLRFARWLVAGLTFQLAADIIETAITVEWDAMGRLAAIGVIRTFLNYFLERDMSEVRALQRRRSSARVERQSGVDEGPIERVPAPSFSASRQGVTE